MLSDWHHLVAEKKIKKKNIRTPLLKFFLNDQLARSIYQEMHDILFSADWSLVHDYLRPFDQSILVLKAKGKT